MSNNEEVLQEVVDVVEPSPIDNSPTEGIPESEEGTGLADAAEEVGEPIPLAQFDNDSIAMLRLVSIYLSLASMLAHSIILVSYVLLKRFKPVIMNRTSLRIVIFNSCLSITSNVLHIFAVHLAKNNAFCAFYGYILNVLALCENFLCLCIALNLNRLFIFMVEPKPSHEYIYYAASMSLAITISTAGLIAGKFGLTDSGKECRFVTGGQISSYIWTWALYYLWIAFSTLYCFYVAIHVGYMLLKERKSLMDCGVKEVGEGEEGVKTKKQIYRLASRVVIYPCISAFTNFPMFLEHSMLVVSKTPNLFISVLSEVSIPSQGILYLIAFMLDPSVQSAFSSVREDRATKSPDSSAEKGSAGKVDKEKEEKADDGDIKVKESEEEEEEKKEVKLTKKEKKALEWGNSAMEFF